MTVVDGRITWFERHETHPLVAVIDVPVTLAGISRTNLENAMAAAAAIDIPHHQPNPFEGPIDYLLEATFSAGWACGAVALWLLARRATNGFARAGWSLAGLGYTALTVVTAGTAVNGGDVLDPVFVVALLTPGRRGASVMEDRDGHAHPAAWVHGAMYLGTALMVGAAVS